MKLKTIIAIRTVLLLAIIAAGAVVLGMTGSPGEVIGIFTFVSIILFCIGFLPNTFGE